LKILAAAVVVEISRRIVGRIYKRHWKQVRPLTKLQPDSSIEVWQQAVAAGEWDSLWAGVKGVVERLMEQRLLPFYSYKLNDVFLISGASGN